MMRALDTRRLMETVRQLKRGYVWCSTCGFTMSIDSVQCLSTGWPKCCGQTMTIDSLEEQEVKS
jgi:hypothetical protein